MDWLDLICAKKTWYDPSAKVRGDIPSIEGILTCVYNRIAEKLVL